MRINTREELEKSRRDYQKSLVCQKKQILICAGTGCVAGGSLQIYEPPPPLTVQSGLLPSPVSWTGVHDRSRYRREPVHRLPDLSLIHI